MKSRESAIETSGATFVTRAARRKSLRFLTTAAYAGRGYCSLAAPRLSETELKYPQRKVGGSFISRLHMHRVPGISVSSLARPSRREGRAREETHTDGSGHPCVVRLDMNDP